MILPKEHNDFLVTDPKERENCVFPSKESKIVVLRKLSEPQENRERQFNIIRKTIHKQNEEFNREIN